MSSGDFSRARDGECSFPGSGAGRSLGLDDSVPSGIVMPVRVESFRFLAGLLECAARRAEAWCQFAIRQMEVRVYFSCRRGDSACPGCEGAHSQALGLGGGLRLEDSVPTGIIMPDRVESSGLLAVCWAAGWGREPVLVSPG